MMIRVSLLLGILLSTISCQCCKMGASPQIPQNIQEFTRELATDGITKDEAIQITRHTYQALWGTPPSELEVRKAELEDRYFWVTEMWWDNGLVGGGIRTRINSAGGLISVELLPGE